MSNEFGATSFREKPDIAQVFLRQLDRTNMAASMTYQEAINQILVLLPTTWRQWVYAQEDRYMITRPTLMYKKFAGRRIGSKNAPALRDNRMPVKRLEDGRIDWNDPNIMSPILQEHTEVDYLKFNELVMEAAEAAGLTWQVEQREQLAGDLRRIKRSKTPYNKPSEVDEDVES